MNKPWHELSVEEQKKLRRYWKQTAVSPEEGREAFRRAYELAGGDPSKLPAMEKATEVAGRAEG